MLAPELIQKLNHLLSMGFKPKKLNLLKFLAYQSILAYHSTSINIFLFKKKREIHIKKEFSNIRVKKKIYRRNNFPFIDSM